MAYEKFVVFRITYAQELHPFHFIVHFFVDLFGLNDRPRGGMDQCVGGRH